MRACVVRGGCHIWGGELKRSQMHTLELLFLGLVAESITRIVSSFLFMVETRKRHLGLKLRLRAGPPQLEPTALELCALQQAA